MKLRNENLSFPIDAVVFLKNDLRREHPIRIKKVDTGGEETIYKGFFANDNGKVVTKKFKHSEIKLA